MRARFSLQAWLSGLFLSLLALSSSPAHADIPALCEPAKRRLDQAVASGDRSAAIAARDRIRVLANACPQLWKAAQQRVLPPERTIAPAKAVAPPKKAAPNPPGQTVQKRPRDLLMDQIEKAVEAGDYPKLQEALNTACSSGPGLRCLTLSREVRSLGIHKPPQVRAQAMQAWNRARTMLADECNRGIADSCSVASEEYFDFSGGNSDLPKARALLEKGCSLGNAQSCDGLGHYLERGWGGPKDYGRARSLMARACSAGRDQSCSNLAAMYENGLGGPVDFVRAREYYGQACRLGTKWACDQQKRLK
jgi:hypothetical protein